MVFARFIAYLSFIGHTLLGREYQKRRLNRSRQWPRWGPREPILKVAGQRNMDRSLSYGRRGTEFSGHFDAKLAADREHHGIVLNGEANAISQFATHSGFHEEFSGFSVRQGVHHY